MRKRGSDYIAASTSVNIDNLILLKGKLRLIVKRRTFINSKQESEFGSENR